MAILRFKPRVAANEELAEKQLQQLSDEELVELFDRDARRAWDLFVDRYSDFILSCLRHIGFDHDQAMDRFVFVCEKLCEQHCRRLKAIRFAGQRGELKPWLRTVIERLAINWAWSVEGRRRLFKSIEALPDLEKRVFELHFWQGLPPSRVAEQLRVEEQRERQLGEVFDALETIFAHLDGTQTWRLMSGLARSRRGLSLSAGDDELADLQIAAVQGSPEENLLDKERRQTMGLAMDELAPRDRLILQLRFEDALTLAEVAQIVGVSLSTVKNSIRASRQQLSAMVGRALRPQEGDPCPDPVV